MASVDREKLLQTAQKYVDKKKYSKALTEYGKVIAANPNDVRTLLKMGDLRLKLNEYEQAIDTYEQVGEYYYSEGFSVKAIAVYKQIRGIIRRHANHLEGRYGHIVPRLADIYTHLGLTSDALAAYDEVATRLRQQGRERDALDIFRKVTDLDPQNPIAHLRMADSRARLGDISQAVDGFGEAARLMLKLGRHDDAMKVLERLLEYRQDAKYARMAAQLYLDRQGPSDGMAALSKLQICFKANPKDLSTLAILARAFDAINQPKKAVEVLKESARIAREKGDTDAFEALMETLMHRAPEDTLVRQFQVPPSVNDAAAPESVEASEEIEVQELSIEESISEVFELTDGDVQTINEPDGTLDLFAAEITEDSSTIEQALVDADAYRTAGQLARAIELIRDTLQSHGDSTRLRRRLGEILAEAGDLSAATNERLLLATQLATSSRVDEALGILNGILKDQPEHRHALHLHAQLGVGESVNLLAIGEDNEALAEQQNAPLASYDVESGGVDEALTRGTPGQLEYVPPDPSVAGTSPPSTRGALDEDALDRAEFLAGEGKFDEARALIYGQLQQFPDHPLVLGRLAEINSMHSALGNEQSLDAKFAGADPTAAPELAEIRANPVHIKDNVADDDAAMHYELGVAKLQMGLHQEAIAALELAARDAEHECVALSVVGNIHLQLNDIDAALNALHRAISAQHRTRDQELAVGYEIANCYELCKMPEQALQYFEWVAMIHPDHDDPRGNVTDRIHRLRGGSGPLRLPLPQGSEADEA